MEKIPTRPHVVEPLVVAHGLIPNGRAGPRASVLALKFGSQDGSICVGAWFRGQADLFTWSAEVHAAGERVGQGNLRRELGDGVDLPSVVFAHEVGVQLEQGAGPDVVRGYGDDLERAARAARPL